MITANKMYDNLLEWGIATGEELALVSSIMGHSVGTYEAVLFSRTGYRYWEDFKNSETEEDCQTETNVPS